MLEDAPMRVDESVEPEPTEGEPGSRSFASETFASIARIVPYAINLTMVTVDALIFVRNKRNLNKTQQTKLNTLQSER